jgi:hypothetical protein
MQCYTCSTSRHTSSFDFSVSTASTKKRTNKKTNSRRSFVGASKNENDDDDVSSSSTSTFSTKSIEEIIVRNPIFFIGGIIAGSLGLSIDKGRDDDPLSQFIDNILTNDENEQSENKNKSNNNNANVEQIPEDETSPVLIFPTSSIDTM